MTQRKAALSAKMIETLSAMVDGKAVAVNGSQAGYFKRHHLAKRSEAETAVPYKSMMRITSLGRSALAEAKQGSGKP